MNIYNMKTLQKQTPLLLNRLKYFSWRYLSFQDKIKLFFTVYCLSHFLPLIFPILCTCPRPLTALFPHQWRKKEVEVRFIGIPSLWISWPHTSKRYEFFYVIKLSPETGELLQWIGHFPYTRLTLFWSPVSHVVLWTIPGIITECRTKRNPY